MQDIKVASMCSVVLLMAMVGCNERVTAPSEAGQNFSALATAGVGSWTPRASMPTRRQGLAAAVVQNGSGQYILYAIGGCCGTSYASSALARVEAYNASTNTWIRKADLPAKRANLNGAEVIGGKIYVPGGADANGVATKTLYVYNPTTNTWSQKANLPRSTAGGITGVIAGKLYVVTGTGVVPQRLYRYDPSTNVWTRQADLPRDHRSGSGAVINGKFYVVWGHSPTVDAYDPASNKWTRRLTMSKTDWPQYSAIQPDGSVSDPVLVLSGAINLSNRLHLIGGVHILGDNDPAWSAETHAYDPATNRWTKRASLARTRADMGVGKVKNAAGRLQIIVTGGEADPFDGEDIVRTTEVFTP